ncbi:peptidylprolyl isomerase [Celeribacter neptunius]|uniref:Parvulin-like PPIase n=1 Tax=Celeribacter neptunius TaxID=588602 RepID=A0A1I3KF56_9RHOB|nr:peptidylprolyl isomerase [Celeribacter neptunius]SFI70980.1 periplasmic chaperone for outer membrane proteins SurA [Celeribacter neptunius]
MTRKFGAKFLAATVTRALTITANITGRPLRAMMLTLPLLAQPGLAAAQNMFAPVAYVNDKVVTRYELDQRMQLLSTLGGGTSRQAALDALIEDRLKMEAADRIGFAITDEQIAQGIAEFASRGNLQPEQFLSLMARNGVSAQTVRDFLSVGLTWRDYVRGRFASKAQVSESEIDRALQENGPSGGLRVLLSELFLPARTPEEAAQSEALAKQIAANPSVAAFAAAATKYSVAPSRDKAGRMDWSAIGDLPPPLRAAVIGLKPGEISTPLSTGNAIGIFQLRSVAETDTPTPPADAIEYAAYYIAGGHSEAAMKRAAEVEAQVDTCDDLYGIAKGEPESVLQIDTLPVGQIPNDVALELAKLDPGEVSTALTRADGQTLVFLMMCGRSYAAKADADRDQIRNQLQSARLSALADSFLAEMRADATIVIP